jgi:hypothetical protein
MQKHVYVLWQVAQRYIISFFSKVNNGGLIATLGHYKQYRNIYPSKLQTLECQNNLEILSDTKHKWFSYQSE